MRKNKMICMLALGMMLSVTACEHKDTASNVTTVAEDSTTASATDSERTQESSDVSAIFADGSGSETEPYQIETADQFVAFAQSVNDGSNSGYKGQYITLTADIDLSDTEWSPIGNMDDMETYSTMFLGSFDGANHTVSNLKYISDEYHCGVGLFGINCGSISNITVENAEVTITETENKSQAIGALVGYNMGGTVTNAHAKNVTVTGNACVSGLIGGSGNGTISDCSAENVTVTVLGDNDFSNGLVQDDIAECGGLVIGGGFGGTIDNCTASGTIKAEGNEPVGLGGIGGCLEMMDSVTNCTVSGKINNTITPGTIAGRAENSTITDCQTDVLVDGETATDEVGKTDVKYESADQ